MLFFVNAIFWAARGTIHIDYLEKGRTMIGEYYSNLLDRFNEDLKKKRPHLAKKKVFFHQGNASAYKSIKVMIKINELGYELLPVNYFLFRNLKKCFAGRRFSSNEEVIIATNAYFEGLKKSYYLEEIQKLEKLRTKCIELKGEK